ncbi:protein kinase domain-containing protein [Streptomyces triticiradicis]|uniref:protein kinase domain-containing protein n=1 Tax=Streptomyces triticiradicis TaxID=2651189 RepID=UPI001788DFBD|nr:protein kinase [Streptomyces triticiradicis]
MGDAWGPGTTLAGGRYRIDAKLGSGGMAEVFRAYDTKLARTVALKVMLADLSSDDGYPARFRREAQAMAAISHPQVVAVHDMGDEPVPYIVMELVEGRSLADLLAARRHLPVTQALDLASQVLAGLAVAHAQGLVHRDIKPGNVLLAADGTAKVADFGIARAAEGTGTILTRTGLMIGTPHFMSPEQVLGRSGIDPRSDLYSVGVMLFQMLTGRLPFEADSGYSIGYLHLTAPPPTLASLGVAAGPVVEAALARALAKDPDQRYPDAESMRAALREPAPAPPPPPQPAFGPPQRPAFGPPQQSAFGPPQAAFGPSQQITLGPSQQTTFVPPQPPRSPGNKAPRGPVSRVCRLVLALALLPLMGLMISQIDSQESTKWVPGIGLLVSPVLGLWLSCSAVTRRGGRLSKGIKISATVGIVFYGALILILLIGAMNDLS